MKEIFWRAAELEGDARPRFLDDACPSAALRTRVERMLRALDGGDSWLTTLAGFAVDRTASPEGEDEPELPVRIGRYEIVRRVAAGGMGIVLEAVQEHPRRQVALKVLRHGLEAGRARRRFEFEAEVLARLHHPAIAQIYECGVWRSPTGPLPYFAMEFVRGARTIIAHASEQELSSRDRLRLFLVICDAVSHGHHKGVIHRDVKPDNILVDEAGRVKVIDFGVARAVEPSGAATATMAGQLIGTLRYMSPEQCGAGTVDTRSDVYSLGMVLYELLTGAPPFPDEPFERVIRRILSEEPPPPRSVNRRVGPDAELVILRAIEKSVERRYQSVEELSADIRALLEHQPIKASAERPHRRAAKWARRNKALASSLASVVLVAAVFLAASAFVRWRGRSGALAEVREIIDRQAAHMAEHASRMDRLTSLSEERSATHQSEQQDGLIRSLERELEGLRLAHELEFSRASELLAQASRLGASEQAVRHLRGRLYLVKFFEAATTHDATRERAYLDLVLANDPYGELAAELRRTRVLDIRTSPPGADVYVYEMRQVSELSEDGERRFVPMPVGAANAPIEPGAWALCVSEGSGPLARGDLVFSINGHPIRGAVLVEEGGGRVPRLARLVAIDGETVRDLHGLERLLGADGEDAEHRFVFEHLGERIELRGRGLGALGISVATPRSIGEIGGVPAEVWSGDALHSMDLPPGLTLRTTAAPIVLGQAAWVGRTPAAEVRLPWGPHLIVIRAQGYEDAVIPYAVWGVPNLADRSYSGFMSLDVQLGRGIAPEGFVYCAEVRLLGSSGPFWIMEREVTFGEYLEFLNDPATRRLLSEGGGSPLAPRAGDDPLVRRGEDDAYAAGPSVREDWPVVGVSWHDAAAYARWRTAAAREKGLPLTFALPTNSEWEHAGCLFGRYSRYVYGEYVQPRWFKCAFSRSGAPAPEPPMSFPIDRSFFGVYDMTGSVAEWLADDYQGIEGRKWVKGASWADGGPPSLFRVGGGAGHPPELASARIGFRLVCRVDEDGAAADER